MSESKLLKSLRVPVREIREALGLSEHQFENFKIFTRRVHDEMVQNQDFAWSRGRTEWRALPEEQIEHAIRLLQDRSSTLFQSQPMTPVMKSVFRARLYHTRRNWQIRSRDRDTPKEPREAETVHDQASQLYMSRDEVELLINATEQS